MAKAAARKRYVIDGDTYIPSYLSHINNRLSSGASQLYLRHFGVGLNEWRILSVLSNRPGRTATQISETVAMHKTVVSRSLRDMEAKGLVRIGAASGQRLVGLTPAGEAMHDRIAPIALEREKLLVQDFSAEEREAALGLLRRMLDNIAHVNAWDPFDDAAAARKRPAKA